MQPGTSRPVSLVGRSFVTRRAFPMHHGENTVTAKSRASTRKAYIGVRFITRLTHVSSSGLARQEIRPLATESGPAGLLSNTRQHQAFVSHSEKLACTSNTRLWMYFFMLIDPITLQLRKRPITTRRYANSNNATGKQ